MPTTNARKHKIPAGGEQTVTRATIFQDFANSIRDVVPVATVTERGQLVTALNSAGEGPTAARPLVVLRADARGLHRVEYTTDGTVWLPTSGVLEFVSKAAADSFATANGGLLTAGDRARISGVEFEWTGSAWVGDWVSPALINSWVAWGGGFQAPRYSRLDGVVHVEGAMKSGGANVPVWTMPSGYRPAADLIFITAANAGVADVRVSSAGVVVVSQYYAGGSNAIVSMNFSYRASA